MFGFGIGADTDASKLPGMGSDVHITEAARRLGVSVTLLRRLEREGKIPLARRDLNGRNGRVYYNHFEVALLRALGVGQRPRRLKRPEELLGGTL